MTACKWFVFFALLTAFIAGASDSELMLEADIKKCGRTVSREGIKSPLEVVSALLAHKPEVVFFGENHLHGLEEFYVSSIKHIKSTDSDFDCLFLEADWRLNIYLDSSKNWHKIKEFGGPLDLIKMAVTIAERTGVKLFAIDRTDDIPDHLNLNRTELLKLSEEERNAFVKASLEWAMRGAIERNHFMIERIRDLISSGSCNKGVMIVGKAHLRGHSEYPELVPLQKGLSEYRTAVFDIRGHMRTLSSDEVPLCRRTPDIGFGKITSPSSGWVIVHDEKAL